MPSQIDSREIRPQRFRPHSDERPEAVERIGAHQIDRPESARVIKRDPAAIFGIEQQMVMFLHIVGVDSPAPRHAEVEDQRIAPVGIDQAIFGAAGEAGDSRPGQPLTQVDRHGMAQVGTACLDMAQPLSVQYGTQTCDRGFHFR